MTGAIMNKFFNLFGVDERDEDEEIEDVKYGYEDVDVEEEDEGEERGIFSSIGKRKIVSMPQPQQVKMVISQPTVFEQAVEICDLLKQRKSIIVNLEYVNKDVARRIIDVLSGAVHVLEGTMQKVSNSIILVAPVNYEITNDMAREEIKNKLSVSWLR